MFSLTTQKNNNYNLYPQNRRQNHKHCESEEPEATEPLYPWNNTLISSYYMWAENFVNSSPAIQFFPGSIYSQQTQNSISSNSYTSSLQYVYNGYSFSGLNANSIFFFTGFSNVTSALTAILTYPETGSNTFYNATMFGLAYEYITQTQGLIISNSPNSSTALIGPCFGGATVNGGWSPGTSGAIYSIYEAVTTNGAPFSYFEAASDTILSGTGTGILQSGFVSNEYTFNALTFDIESYGSTGTGSVGQDFLNLFTYIKTNANSVFLISGIILIVTIGHSCSNFNGTGQSVCSSIYMNQSYYPEVSTLPNYVSGLTTYSSNSTYSWDYISPQLYTQNTGIINEYAANSNIYWTGVYSFVSYIQQNPNFSIYGQNLILPSILLPELNNSGGNNNGNPPNLYFYQSSANNVNPIVESSLTEINVPYTIDTGAVAFFNTIFESSSTLGGYFSWVNGTLSSMPTAPPNSLSDITNGSYIWLDSKNNYWGMYVSQSGFGPYSGSPFNNPVYIPTGSAYNTLICQVYGAGAGGGGNAPNLTTGGTGYGGGGGAGAYCCFSIAASDPINGLIEIYIPGGGGGGFGGNSTQGGGVGGGGGYSGNSTGDETMNYLQIPTSVWWNSNSLNSVYTMVASVSSGTGGGGFSSSGVISAIYPDRPYEAEFASILITQYLSIVGGVSVLGLTSPTIYETLTAASQYYIAEALLDLTEVLTTGGAQFLTDLTSAAITEALAELIYNYNDANQGVSGTGSPPFIGKPYGSYTLNNLIPVQSGATQGGIYSNIPKPSYFGCSINGFNESLNPLQLGFGGNFESPGFPGAVIFTLTNSTPGNSI